jgi:CBS domain containing-hemolysin-like protein
VWLFNSLSTLILKASGLPTRRDEEITTEDISAMVDAGTQAGVLHKQEQAVIENVFELESRTVPSSMTHRDSIVYLMLDESEADIKRKIADQPHTKFPVCRDTVDEVVGYVDAKDLLRRALEDKRIALTEPGLVKAALFVPDTLSLAEVLEAFKRAREDFALILNEYAMVVGLVTINDVMSTVMGELVQPQEDQIVRRDADSWLVDGITSITDVRRVLEIDEFPDEDNYETLGGFLMYRLRKIPKRTDCVSWAGYKFEVVDIDNHKIDQVLVTRLPPEPVAG